MALDDGEGWQRRVTWISTYILLSNFRCRTGMRIKKMKKFKPLHDNVLIRRKEQMEKTPGGVIIPDKLKDKPVEGEVLAVGPGIQGKNGCNCGGDSSVIPLTVKVGDIVLFSMYAGTYVRVTDEELVTMKESDILGVIAE